MKNKLLTSIVAGALCAGGCANREYYDTPEEISRRSDIEKRVIEAYNLERGNLGFSSNSSFVPSEKKSDKKGRIVVYNGFTKDENKNGKLDIEDYALQDSFSSRMRIILASEMYSIGSSYAIVITGGPHIKDKNPLVLFDDIVTRIPPGYARDHYLHPTTIIDFQKTGESKYYGYVWVNGLAHGEFSSSGLGGNFTVTSAIDLPPAKYNAELWMDNVKTDEFPFEIVKK